MSGARNAARPLRVVPWVRTYGRSIYFVISDIPSVCAGESKMGDARSVLDRSLRMMQRTKIVRRPPGKEQPSAWYLHDIPGMLLDGVDSEDRARRIRDVFCGLRDSIEGMCPRGSERHTECTPSPRCAHPIRT